jgi:hypothetical protein
MSWQSQRGQYLDRPRSSSLADVVDLILDKGLVIDAFVRVSVIGIELITIDARIVIASVDTYLKFAEAVGRLDLSRTQPRGLPEVIRDTTRAGVAGKAAGKAEDVLDTVKEKVSGVMPHPRSEKQPEGGERDRGQREGS